MAYIRCWVRGVTVAVMVAVIGGLGGCATKPPASDPEARAEYERINDPLEPLNRATHEFNMGMDKVILKPIAQVYRFILPQPIRTMITNFLHNLQAPLVFANNILQGDFEEGANTLGRFVTNTTIGVGGLFDPATGYGLERRNTSFGDTLAVWGAGEGFYLVLPFLGPSNPRDALGFGVEFFADPVSIYLDDQNKRTLSIARTGLEVIDFRERNLDSLESLERQSTDLYAAMRSAYRQNRAFRLGEESPEDDIFDEELE